MIIYSKSDILWLNAETSNLHIACPTCMSEGSQAFSKFAATLAEFARKGDRSLARWLGIESMMMMIRLGGAGILLVECAL